MNDGIIKLLNFEDRDILIRSISIKDSTKFIELEKPPAMTYCPLCLSRMNSKGIRTRSVNHPILQDGFHLVLLLRQRRWQCTNPLCKHLMNDEFTFVEPRKRNTNMMDFLVLQEFKNINASASDIAKRFHISDTHALQIFDKYVDLDRLPLTEAICIDEVYIDMDKGRRYALLIMDFFTGELIDVIESRRNNYTEPYFAAIPINERKRVRYLITDMYKPYISFIDKYFPNALSVVDSFHVIKTINHSIESFIRSLIRRFRQEDEKLHKLKEFEKGHEFRMPVSDEVYLLKNHKWVLLRNVSNIDYTRKSRFDRHFRCYMDTYSYEAEFMKIHPDFHAIRDLKEEYIHFNTFYASRPEEAAEALENLILKYEASGYTIFEDFARVLREHSDAIVRSFTVLKRQIGDIEISSRLSNGPLESMNRKPKDMRRTARGYTNFEHFRNRLLFATRKDAPIRAVPKTRMEIQHPTGRRRGPYNKTSTCSNEIDD